MCRYLADQPLAWPERLQPLLPALLGMQGQAACPFLLPFLTQLADPLELASLQAQAEQAGDLGWPACLRQPEVGMMVQPAEGGGSSASAQQLCSCATGAAT